MAVISGLKVVYGLYDHTIDTDTDRQVNPSSQTEYSQTSLDELLDKEENWKCLTYLEKNYWKLDGTNTTPASKTAQFTGWESAEPYDSDGAGKDYIEFEFADLHSSYGITLVFAEDCIPQEFSIAYYEGEELKGEDTVSDNVSADYTNTSNNKDWNLVVITFTQVPAGQRARLLMVTFGIVDTYTSDTLIKVTASRTTDVANDYNDCGAVTFELYNTGRFAVSTIKDLPESLQGGQECCVYVISPEGNTDLFMTYTSQSTAIKEEGRVLDITAYDRLYSLNETTYSKGTMPDLDSLNPKTLADLAMEVAEDAGLTSDEFMVEDYTGSLSAEVTGYIPETTHREALRLIAEAGNAILYVDRANVLHLTTLQAGTDTVEYSNNDIVQDSWNQNNESNYKAVKLTAWTFTQKSYTELASYSDEPLTGLYQKYDVTYSKYPAYIEDLQIILTDSSCKVYYLDDDGTYQLGTVTGGNYWTVPTAYAEHVVFYLLGTAGNTTNITIMGTPYSSTSNDYTMGTSNTDIKKITKNYLINEDTQESVLEWQYRTACNRYETEAEVLPPYEPDAEGIPVYTQRTDRDTGAQTYIESDILDTITFTEQGTKVDGVPQGESITATKIELSVSSDGFSWTVTGQSVKTEE